MIRIAFLETGSRFYFKNRDPVFPEKSRIDLKKKFRDRFFFEKRGSIFGKKSGIDFALRLSILICHGFLIDERFYFKKRGSIFFRKSLIDFAGKIAERSENEKWGAFDPEYFSKIFLNLKSFFAEKHRIVAKFDAPMALCDELEARLKERAAGSLRNLRQNKSHAAFPSL